MKNKLQSFSVILLVKGRIDFTKRWLNYMSEISFPYKIIIADGEDDNLVNQLIISQKFSKNLDIEFLQFNTHDGYESYFHMLKTSISSASTEYVMLCDNDDFILPEAIKDILKFLDKNSSYISAGGKIINFEIDNYKNLPYGKIINFLKPYSYSRENEPVSNYNEHINNVFSSFQPNFYNIFRKETLEIIACEIKELNFSDLVPMEFYIQLRSATLGKSKVLLNHSHYLRQRGTSQISNNFNFFHKFLDTNLSDDVKKLSNKISEVVSGQEDISNNIRTQYAEYLNVFIAHTTLRYRFKKLYKIKLFFSYCYEFCPKFLKKIILFLPQLKLKKVTYSKFKIKKSINTIHDLLIKN